MYKDWGFEPAGKRDRTHSGFTVLAMQRSSAKKRQQLSYSTNPSGSCLADLDLPSILTHVKNCTLLPTAFPSTPTPRKTRVHSGP